MKHVTENFAIAERDLLKYYTNIHFYAKRHMEKITSNFCRYIFDLYLYY